MDIITLIIILSLIMLGVISFPLFIRRLLIKTTPRSSHTSSVSDIDKKLDKIIMLLEENKYSK